MADDQDDSQKTEEPTQKRLDEARQKGQVASSREINHWFMIGAGTLLLISFAPQTMGDMARALSPFIESPDAIATDIDHLRRVMLDVFGELLASSAPPRGPPGGGGGGAGGGPPRVGGGGGGRPPRRAPH